MQIGGGVEVCFLQWQYVICFFSGSWPLADYRYRCLKEVTTHSVPCLERFSRLLLGGLVFPGEGRGSASLLHEMHRCTFVFGLVGIALQFV